MKIGVGHGVGFFVGTALVWLLFGCLFSGCTDYSSLSKGDASSSDADLGDDQRKTISAPDLAEADLADADLAGVDLANTDSAHIATIDLATTDSAEPPPLPASCKDINDVNQASNDGNYTLYYNRDAAKSWTAWCKGMGSGGNPVEYLTLPAGVSSAYSIMGADLQAYSQFSKLRIDPVTLKIDVTDATYNLVTGVQHYGCTAQNSMYTQNYPLVYAYHYCGTNTGTAHLDLRGTPFKIAQDAFTITGAATVTYSQADQVVDLNAPPTNTRVQATGAMLQLVMP